MKIKQTILKISTKNNLQFVDLTNEIEKFVSKSKIKFGQLLVYSRHTTLAIRVNEKETGIFNDMEEFLNKLLPKNRYYRHNDLEIRTENLVCSPETEECLNGHSHCRHFLLSTSETIPIQGGTIALGTWQKVMAVELDGPRKREILLQLIGE
ncbi:hypothetical protein AUK11_02395 [bacterium CG2_30_37_16]|nr:MAG: hypothetical protein AUK11_02395 [bacterium CG2_30_37_16]PIP30259.1 MAG: secondary thiamine-phosphate synthase enzyme [bacterium (Candidatus Howlettbacteria) CG23_combo_of_CG06-09_8_20_14_all_37_9]PIY00091.1 MAG: secondary thiamine-phosphate synthase enzyme [bacterium (Candidatus Howlettbacteria) CG_4_10_14_3_um_filter_37_10]PJB06553.1 MAG: secondary thiamine-phosphate synthase enzyme [bacterium (Candidatus Howlettbacteria) CG_4_9_14_3_um_filter_37_10]